MCLMRVVKLRGGVVYAWAAAVYHSLLILEARGNVSRIRAKGRRYVVWDVLVLPRPKRDANARK